MSSLNQLVSEFIHATGIPNNVPMRRNVRYAILHTRNELIRQSYSNHNYLDKGLEQRFRATLINVPDGDVYGSGDIGLQAIKRTKQKVPKPVRLINNLPFQSVRTVGYKNISIAFVREHAARYYSALPGFCNNIVYDYINGYLYFFGDKEYFRSLGAIVIESAFEVPYIIPEETIEAEKDVDYDHVDDEVKFDDDEFLLPEDMVEQIKVLVYQRDILQIVRQDNQIPKENLIR